MTTIKNAVIALVFVMLCAGLAFAAIPPLDGLMTPPSIVSSTVTGKAVRALSGKLCVAASSATAGTCTTSIDGTLGINSTKQITASSATFSSSTVTGTGTFNKITVTGATSLSGATASGNITASSFTASGIGISAPRWSLSNGSVVISSEATASLGGGIRISSNVYIVGFSSASRYFGDGSGLSGVIVPYYADGQSLTLTGSTFSARGSSVTLQGNTFNTANTLVKLDSNGKMPAVDGSALTNLPSTEGGAVLAATQTFSGINTFTKNPITSFDYGTGTPTSTPTAIGNIYISTNTGNIYIAVGTSGTWNWGLVGAGNVTPWTQTSPANLYMWYKADSGVTPTTGGSTVTGWSDMSGTGMNLSQNWGTHATVSTITQNGLPMVYFDGAGSLSSPDKGNTAQPYTLFIAFKPTTWANGTYQAIYEDYSSNILVRKANGSTSVNLYSGAEIVGPAVTNGAASLITAVGNGESSSISLNGGTPTTGNAGTAAVNNYSILGCVGGSSYCYTGHIMEILRYNALLSADDQAKVRNYLNAKWAIY